jgi:hypothetical protein
MKTDLKVMRDRALRLKTWAVSTIGLTDDEREHAVATANDVLTLVRELEGGRDERAQTDVRDDR